MSVDSIKLRACRIDYGQIWIGNLVDALGGTLGGVGGGGASMLSIGLRLKIPA